MRLDGGGMARKKKSKAATARGKPQSARSDRGASSNRRPARRSAATARPGAAAEGVGEQHPDGMRLQKYLATSGVDSRRNCEEYIRTGRVTIDGRVAEDPAEHVDGEAQVICLDGERLRPPRLRYYLINKPKGVLCTNRDPQGRPRAIDLVPAHGQRLFTVGRLDESTEGLLLITNDGDLADKLAHPRYEVVRRYRVQVAGIPDAATLQQLRDGMHFADGFFRFRSVRFVSRRGRSAILELELREGKNREIRRLLARVGHKVTHLSRIAFGPLRIGILHSGRYRELSQREVTELRDFVNNGDSEHRTRSRGTGKKRAAGSRGTGTAGRRKQKKASPRKKAPMGSQPQGKGRSRRKSS
jgi:23S rRNA pseudouridine2605 synthase